MPTGSAAQRRSSLQPGIARAFEVALVAALLVLLLSTVSKRTRGSGSFRSDAGDVQQNPSGDIRLTSGGVLFEIVGRPRAGEEVGELRAIRDAHGVSLEALHIGALVDGAPMKIIADKPRTTPAGPTHVSTHVVLSGQEASFEADLGYTMTRTPAALTLSLKLRSVQPHSVALTLSTSAERVVPFVRGAGLLVDSGDASGPVVIFEGKDHAAGVGSLRGEVALHLGPSGGGSGSFLAATVSGQARPSNEADPLFVAPGTKPSAIVDAAARLRQDPTRHLAGRVLGGETDVDVWGVNSEGRPLVHVKPGPDGRFEVVAPMLELGFYATMAHTRASPIVNRIATDNSELELNMLPGGEARVRVEDFDTGEPLTARLIVHGLPPTADPNFGPDYRSSGAGPLVDALRGDATMPLPTGRYRILATRGPEYSIDEQPLDIAPGSTHDVRLALRHVVDTPGLVGCDLHVHARPSFDAPVLPEDRVTSLVAAGIDFAVPSEHNVVGHYEPALEALELTRELATVPGVEITTMRPALGHFNVFPFTGPVPPFRKTTVKRIFTKARGGDPTRVLQVNHPRLAGGIGYFDLMGLDTKTGRAERDFRDDFDSLEVYNGFDAANRAQVETVLVDWLRLLMLGHRYVATGDSDSHRIQYQWAGYPRTYVMLPPDLAGDTGNAIDTTALIASLKAGHVMVTSGPVVSASIDGQGPGSTVSVAEATVRLHVSVRAAPWIDVTEIEVMGGTTSLARLAIPSRPRVTGQPLGDLARARMDAIRFERDFDVAFDGASPRFLVVVVRGTRAMDDVLPYTPFQPLAFTNPIWLSRGVARSR